MHLAVVELGEYCRLHKVSAVESAIHAQDDAAAEDVFRCLQDKKQPV